jgi:hypothetical protein
MELQGVLAKLVADLRISWDALNHESVRLEIQDALHKNDRLPERKMASTASDAVDLLHQLQQLLEPGHLILADHFLGLCLIVIFIVAIYSRHSYQNANISFKATLAPNAYARPWSSVFQIFSAKGH